MLQNAGPHAPEAMPEAGYLPIPKKLAQEGVKDMVRVSDARMSGTAFGTIVLHVTPDAASGGPLGLVRNGDRIRLSVKERRIELLVDDAELKQARRAAASRIRDADARLFQALRGADPGRRRGLRFRIPAAAIGNEEETTVKSEAVKYSVGGASHQGQLIYDESKTGHAAAAGRAELARR